LETTKPNRFQLNQVQTLIGNNQTEQIPAQSGSDLDWKQPNRTDSSSIRGGSNCLKREGQNQRGGGEHQAKLVSEEGVQGSGAPHDFLKKRN